MVAVHQCGEGVAVAHVGAGLTRQVDDSKKLSREQRETAFARLLDMARAGELQFGVAAASILAKVIRDRAMTRLAARYPAFGWETNAGYGTSTHTQALAQIGPCKHHRLSFAPCAQFVLSL